MEKPLDKYLRLRCSLSECEALDWIEKQTNIKTNYPQMLSGKVQGSLLKMLVGICGARKALEVGTFTGYSSCCIAFGLPENGHLDALEINEEMEDIIRASWQKAGVSGKITLHIGDALKTMEGLGKGTYDFAFVDANKREYSKYLEAVLPLVRKGGLIVFDDVLWEGKVYSEKPDCDMQTRSLVAFNDAIAKDRRLETVMLPLRDGLTLARKLF